MRIHTVFWGSDNTLVETAKHHWRKHVEVLKTLDIILDDSYRAQFQENNDIQNYKWIAQDLGLTLSQADYLSAIYKWYIDHIDEIKIRKGVMEALDYFKENNLDQAIVSSEKRAYVMAVLEAKKLTLYFKFILCNENYAGCKPDPDPYLAAFEKIQTLRGEKLSTHHCMVIEDDPLGVQAGEAAEMIVLYRPISDTSSIKNFILNKQ